MIGALIRVAFAVFCVTCLALVIWQAAELVVMFLWWLTEMLNV